MVEIDKIDKIFDSVVQNSIFKNKTVLQSNYTPETIVHREEQIENIALILAPSLRGERVSNLFLYGNTGTGKTLSIQHVGSKLLSKNREMADLACSSSSGIAPFLSGFNSRKFSSKASWFACAVSSLGFEASSFQ